MSNISLEHDSLFLAANKIFTFIYDDWKNYLFILFVFLMYIVVAIRIATPGKQEEVVNNVIKYIPKLQYQFVHFLSFLPKYQNLT